MAVSNPSLVPSTSAVSQAAMAVAGLALIHQLHGESAAASQLVEAISHFDLEQFGSEDVRTGSIRARLMLLQGDLEGAGRWADAFRDPPPDQAVQWLEEPQLTRARILIARGRYTDLQSALNILGVLVRSSPSRLVICPTRSVFSVIVVIAQFSIFSTLLTNYYAASGSSTSAISRRILIRK